MTNSAYYYVLHSKNSANSQVGLRPKTTYMLVTEIIEIASGELNRAGKFLEDLAGIDFVENENGDFVPARELTESEIFEYSVEKLGDDGRLFEIFKVNEKGAQDFIDAAKSYGLDDAARAVVNNFNS